MSSQTPVCPGRVLLKEGTELTSLSALCTATFAIAKALDNRVIRVLGCVMTCLLIVIWITVFISMIRAVIVKDILWPQKQEDRDEGGFKARVIQEQAPQPQDAWPDGTEETGNTLSRVISALSTRGRKKRRRNTTDMA